MPPPRLQPSPIRESLQPQTWQNDYEQKHAEPEQYEEEDVHHPAEATEQRHIANESEFDPEGGDYGWRATKIDGRGV
jgi:hypothetical protein